MSMHDGCHGGKNIPQAFPEEIRCQCGNTIEIWSNETSRVCGQCKQEVKRPA